MNDFYEALFKEFSNNGVVRRDYEEFFDEMYESYSTGFGNSDYDHIFIPKEHIPKGLRRVSFDSDKNIIFSEDDFCKTGLLGLLQHKKINEMRCKPDKIVAFAKHIPHMDLHIKKAYQESPQYKLPGPDSVFYSVREPGRKIGPNIYSLDYFSGERIFVFDSFNLS